MALATQPKELSTIIRQPSVIDSFIRRKIYNKQVILTKVSYKLEIASGLAVVTQKRVFKNTEKNPIEAVLTFPVGYDAVVFDMQVDIDGRVMTGVARKKEKAREKYEDAIDSGWAAVLHEELLRGLHMLSVGNIKPGGKIVVTCMSVHPVALVGNDARLRIPLTVGQVYGNSPLLPSDDIVADGVAMDAKIKIKCKSDVLVNGVPSDQIGKIKTNAAIDISIPDHKLEPLHGEYYDGRHVTCNFSRPQTADTVIKGSILIDASGSMQMGRTEGMSKWDAVLEGVQSACSEALTSKDNFRIWTFSDYCVNHGDVSGDKLGDFVSKLPFSGGGTSLASAVEMVGTSKKAANVLLVTDGQSHTPINYEKLCKAGARFTVVLVGASALDTHAAHLAAITGGQLFAVDAGVEVKKVVAQAVASMRSVASPITMLSTDKTPFSRQIGGMDIDVKISTNSQTGLRVSDALSPFVASLLVSSLPKKKAEQTAEDAGIVSHLTSILMVDKKGDKVKGIMETRKVSLAQPADMGILGSSGSPVIHSFSNVPTMLMSPSASMITRSVGMGVCGNGNKSCDSWPWTAGPTFKENPVSEIVLPMTQDFYALSEEGYFTFPVPVISVDWKFVLEVVKSQTYSQLPSLFMNYVDRLAKVKDVIRLANATGLNVIRIAIAIAAIINENGDSNAREVSDEILSNADFYLVRDATWSALKVQS